MFSLPSNTRCPPVNHFFHCVKKSSLYISPSCANILPVAPPESTTAHPRKKTSHGESLAESHACNPIRDSGETLSECKKSRQESQKKSHREFRRESRRDSWSDSRQDSWRGFSRSPSVSPRVSDRIICTTLCKTISGTRFFTRAGFKSDMSSYNYWHLILNFFDSC